VDRSQVKFLINRSRRALAYQITDTRSALFKLGPHDTEIELISNLDLTLSGTSVSHDSNDSLPELTDSEWPYELEVTILNRQFQPVSSQVYWETTRQTTWLDEKTGNPMKAAYYLYEDICAADSRITTVHVPGTLGNERYLSVRLASPRPGTAAVRVYKHVNLQSERDVKGLRHLPKKMRAKLARHNLYGDDLSQLELSRSMIDVLSQIPAETRQGFEYVTRQLFLYDYCTPLQGDRPPRFTVSNDLDRPVFFPVTGPAELTLHLNSTEAVRTTIWRDDILLAETSRTPSKNRTLTFDFGAGAHLLKVQGLGSRQKVVDTVLDPPSAWISEDTGSAELYPRQSSAYYRIVPESEGIPVTIHLPPDGDGAGRLVKLICRSALATSDSSTDDAFTVTFRITDAGGHLLDSGTFSGRNVLSDLARYSGSQPDGLRPGTPERFYFSPPDTARNMILTANRPVDVACFVRLNPLNGSIREQSVAGRSGTTAEEIRFQRDVKDQQEYYYFRPRNADILESEGRKAWVSLPRGILEPWNDTGTDPAVADALSIYPPATIDAELIFDPVSGEIDDSGAFVLVTETAPLHIHVGSSDGNARLGFRYDFPETLDPFLAIRVDGRYITRFRPVTSRGYFEIPGIAPGDHRIDVESHSAATRLFMKLPRGVTASGQKYTPRNVFPLYPGQTMTIPVDRRNQHIHGLNIMAYTGESTGTPIRLMVSTDTGTLPTNRALKCLTPPEIHFTGTSPDPAGPHPMHMGTLHPLNGPERFFFPLHDDLKPDIYSITIESGSDYPVYLRFFTLLPDTGQGA